MTTLAKLKTSVDSWLARDDVAVTNSDFPEILLLAESDIARDVHCIVQETSTTLVFTGRSQDLPTDFLSVRTPFIDNTVRRFEYMTPETIRESKAWQNGRAGAFYTLEGNVTVDRVSMTIAGAASASTPLSVDVNYYARFAALTADPDTNWLLTNHFDVYLYAVLRAACEYLQEFALEDRYGSKYERVVDRQNRHEQRKRTGMIAKQAYGSPRTVV